MSREQRTHNAVARAQSPSAAVGLCHRSAPLALPFVRCCRLCRFRLFCSPADLVQPLHLSVLRVENSVLHPPELERELGPELLQPRLLLALEDVAVVTEEDEVALVVEGDDATTLEVGNLVQQTAEHAAHAVAQARVEVVEDHLRLVRRRATVAWANTKKTREKEKRDNTRGDHHQIQHESQSMSSETAAVAATAAMEAAIRSDRCWG